MGKGHDQYQSRVEMVRSADWQFWKMNSLGEEVERGLEVESCSKNCGAAKHRGPQRKKRTGRKGE